MFDSFKAFPINSIYVGKIRTVDLNTRTDVPVKTVAFKCVKEFNGILDSNKAVDTFIPLEKLDIYYYCEDLEPILDYIPTNEVRSYISASKIISIVDGINTGEKCKIKTKQDNDKIA